MHLFHAQQLDAGVVSLPEEEAHHALSVLRLRPGAQVMLFDGNGTSAVAEILRLDKRACELNVLKRETHPEERKAKIHLAVGLTKQADRFEWFVEKAVEVGVDRITPLITERTERGKIRPERLERVALAAAKQSQRFWLPRIDVAQEPKDLLKEELPEQRFFGWCVGEHAPLMRLYTTTADAIVLIGPEGDLSSSEAKKLGKNGFLAVSLGNARLRTETAAIAACTWMSLAQQR